MQSARRRRGPSVITVTLLAVAACTGAEQETRPDSRPAEESAAGADGPPAQYVILISFDGFRADYPDRGPDRGLTPVMDSLALNGMRATLIPVMPTKTFPNHYSIATGMYAGEHRLVANTFMDATLGTYTPADRSTVEDGAWYGGDPIWNVAERQGLRTASMFWVGSEADVQGERPHIWHRFDAALSPEARVDSVLGWLRLPADERPRLLTLYFDFTDTVGSLSGPDSPEADSAIAYADRLVARLIAGAAGLPHSADIAYVIVSDHGMALVEGVVPLDEYGVSLDGVNAMFQGPFVTFYVDGDSARMQALRRQLERVPHTRTYHRSELPAEWRWSDPRLGDLITVGEPGWLIAPRPSTGSPGAHGWPPDMPEMHGIFVASGAGVRRAGRVDAFENVHVHAFVARLLGIEKGRGSADAGPLEHVVAAVRARAPAAR